MNIINTVAELKLYVAVNANMERMPDVTGAEQEFLLPILGEELYAALITAMSGTLNDAMTKLRDHCRRVVAPGAVLHSLSMKQAQVTDAGLTVYEQENTRKAHRWEYEKVQEGLYKQLYAAQERLIVFLRMFKSDYPLWANSPYNDVNGFLLIRDGRELARVQGLEQPHRCYMSLRPLFLAVAKTTVIPMMGIDQYLALNTKIKAGTALSEHEQYVVSELQMAVGHLAMGRAVSMLNIKFGSGGFTVADKYTKEGVDEGRAAADGQKEAMFKKEMEGTGMQVLDDVKKYMDKYASSTVFAEYFASGSYSDPSGDGYVPDPGKNKGMFRV